jgi:hypothetical protein
MLKLNREIGADKVGLDAVALNGTRTGNLIQLSGYDQISIMVSHANSAGALAITYYLEFTNDDGTSYFREQKSAVSSGTAALSDATYSKTVSGAAKWISQHAVHAAAVRIVFPTVSGAGSSDKVTVDVRLGSI